MSAEQIPFEISEATMPINEQIEAAPEAPQGSRHGQPFTTEEHDRLELMTREYRSELVILARNRGAREPEDVVQDTMAYVARFETEQIWPYLRRAVINAVITESRLRNKRGGIATEIQETDVQTVDPALAVEDSLLAMSILKRVDPISRELFLLRFYEDLSIAEIAARQGIPEGTVKARLSRALEKCRRVLAAE